MRIRYINKETISSTNSRNQFNIVTLIGPVKTIETLKKQIKETTTLEVSSAEATVETNNAGKETTTQWVVKWKSDDKKFVKATIKKNKDIKIDKKGSALTDLD